MKTDRSEIRNIGESLSARIAANPDMVELLRRTRRMQVFSHPGMEGWPSGLRRLS